MIQLYDCDNGCVYIQSYMFVVTNAMNVFMTVCIGVRLTLSPSTPILLVEGNSGLTDVSIGITVSWAAGEMLERDVTIFATTLDSTASK